MDRCEDFQEQKFQPKSLGTVEEEPEAPPPAPKRSAVNMKYPEDETGYVDFRKPSAAEQDESTEQKMNHYQLAVPQSVYDEPLEQHQNQVIASQQTLYDEPLEEQHQNQAIASQQALYDEPLEAQHQSQAMSLDTVEEEELEAPPMPIRSAVSKMHSEDKTGPLADLEYKLEPEQLLQELDVALADEEGLEKALQQTTTARKASVREVLHAVYEDPQPLSIAELSEPESEPEPEPELRRCSEESILDFSHSSSLARRHVRPRPALKCEPDTPKLRRSSSELFVETVLPQEFRARSLLTPRTKRGTLWEKPDTVS